MTRFGWRAALAAVVVAAAAGCGGNSSKPAPTITSLTPNTGTVGTLVAVAGSGFTQSGSGATAVNPTVTFTPSAGGAAVPATVTAFSATSLDVAVPEIATNLAAAGTVFDVTVTNPGGGAKTFPKAFAMAAPVTTDVNGGLAGSGTVNSVFIVDGSNFGDLSAAPAGSYSVDFRDASSNSVVASATVDFTKGDWQNIFIVGTVPSSLSASTTYKLTVSTPSGTSAPLNFLVAGAVSFSPSTIQWSATSSLPAGVQGLATSIVPIGTSSFIYAVGGNTAASGASGGKAANVDTVSFNAVTGSSGALSNATWAAATPLPDKRGFAATVSANAFNSLVAGQELYVLGGIDGSGNATSTVYHAALGADGTVPATAKTGTWAATTPLPQPLYALGAVIFHGRIYVAGGGDASGTPVAKVYAAKIAGDGTLGTWETLPDLPVALVHHQLVTSAGYLYVLGGDTAATDPISATASTSSQGTIYYDAINIRNGELASASWTTNAAAMGKNREKFTAVAAGSYLLVSGGLYNGALTGSSEQSYAAINTDGSIGSFNGATGVHTISGSASGYDFYNHAATLFVDSAGNPHVLVLGGANVNTGAVEGGVWLQH
jgi:hypothetical protein